MHAPIVIIGSGFAAYHLVKTIRRLDVQIPIQVFTAHDGAEYNKPDLSHVFSRQQTAQDLVIQSGDAFAQEHNIELFCETRVDKVDTQAQQIVANGRRYPYSKLVFATGAKTFVPPMNGNASDDVMTLNSLQEYQSSQRQIGQAKRVLVIGGGLIGVEMAMDLAQAGKAVTVVEPNSRLLANLIPDFVALPLENQLKQQEIQLLLDQQVLQVNKQTEGLEVTLNSEQRLEVDAIISAAGIRPNSALAQAAGITVNRGIAVDNQLQTSVEHVFALGDCAEIEGRMMPYLQPIILSANVLAKQLLSQPAQLVLSPMMVKVKTPSYPIQLAGNVTQVANWSVQISQEGIVAKAKNEQQQLIGFVVTDNQVKHAFPLLRDLSQSMANQ